jgi:hypothetical protein
VHSVWICVSKQSGSSNLCSQPLTFGDQNPQEILKVLSVSLLPFPQLPRRARGCRRALVEQCETMVPFKVLTGIQAFAILQWTVLFLSAVLFAKAALTSSSRTLPGCLQILGKPKQWAKKT